MLSKTFATAILAVALLALIAVPAFADTCAPDIDTGLQDAQQHELDGGGQANRPDDAGSWYHDGLHEGDE
jgi:hypothetical protein